MAITDQAAFEIAREVIEAVPAIRKFLAMPREDKVLVAKHILDAQIGSDETAVIKNIPGMTADMTELITDPLLDVGAKALVGLLDGPDE
jgi:hypothetical protein